MRFLNARRRHPAARPLLLVFALFVVGAAYSVLTPPTQVAADGSTSADVAAGRQLFSVSCASCHGLNGEGTSQGPTLVGVGSAAVDFQVSTGRMPLAQPAEQAQRKPNVYTDEEIRLLGAYVDSLGPGPHVPSPDQYSAEGLTAEQLARGGELFRTNCSACHNFSGRGGALPEGRYAPPLVGVSGEHIWEALRTGPGQMPVFPQTTLTDEDVRSIIGYLDTLHAQPSGGFQLGGLGPVSEGLWGWLVGIGVLVAFAVWIAAKGVRAR